MKSILKIIISLTVFLSSTVATSQNYFNRNDSIVVLNLSNDTLYNAWSGGFNSVQFSEIDLNLDGIKDLFVFDRSGNRISNIGQTY